MDHEDWFLDDSFKVEKIQEFLNGLKHEDNEFLLKLTILAQCQNCGEWINRKNLKNKRCKLCNTSETHHKIRGGNGT